LVIFYRRKGTMQGGGDEEAQKDIIVVYPESKAYTTQKG
jgi:hypothetical protein